jgi:CPA1 family monovalent cation:H+ antiporter
VLIGVEVVIVRFTGASVLAGALAIPLVLLARWISAGISASPRCSAGNRFPRALTILTWSGLRGGISVALARYRADRRAPFDAGDDDVRRGLLRS